MTLLVISPDYASHLLPLATLATAWRDRGHRVVVATGPSTAGIVESFGFERVGLQLGRGSNPGIIRADDQPDEEADSLRGFFDATREGMVATLAYQARERLTDLMWDPVTAGRSDSADRRRRASRMRSSSTTSRSAPAWRCPSPAMTSPTSCSGIRAPFPSATSSTACRRLARRLPPRPAVDIEELRALCARVVRQLHPGVERHRACPRRRRAPLDVRLQRARAARALQLPRTARRRARRLPGSGVPRIDAT